MSKQSRHQIIFFIAFILLITIACAIPGDNTEANKALEQTQIALGVEQTSMALQHQKMTDEALPAAQPPAQNPPANEVAATYTPFPTYTPYPTEEQQQQPTSEPPTSEPPALSMEERIKGSNVLIFEDIWGEFPLAGDRRVSDAVNAIGFYGGKVVNVGDAMGDFKAHLLSGTPWDLIIISAEVRSSIQGEFWEYMMDHLNRNVAMIAEVWYIDDISFGKIAPVLNKCGVSLQKDWTRDPGYDQLDYSILNLIPQHPIFTTPNTGISLITPNIYWMFDAGDLLKIGVGGDATLLSGIYYNRKSEYGVIAECMGGRTIFQTFSTHDYRYDQTVALWQNYIIYTLTNHYEAIGQ